MGSKVGQSGAARWTRAAAALAVAALIVGTAGALVFASAPAPDAAADEQPAPAAPASEVDDQGPMFDFSEQLAGWLGEWVKQTVLGVAVWQFICAFAFLLGGLVLRKAVDHVFAQHVVPQLKRTPFKFDHLLAEATSKPAAVLALLAGLAAAAGVLTLPREPNIRGLAFGALKVLAAADVVWFLFRVVDVGVEYLTRLAKRTESKLDDQLVPLIRKALKVTIGLVCGVWALQLLGYSVSSLLAGLGIGGLAVALALQDTLANFFGSVFIFLDRPFRLGDWVKVGDVEGTVEGIGFRSTRIRTWPATLVAIPNRHVADSAIDNCSKMPKRRVFQTVGVTYETTADEMEQAVSAIRDILRSDEGVDQEFIVVRFGEFGASSLDITVYYFTRDIAYADHMATKERVNLAIMRALKRLGLSVAFPTRTVYFEGGVAKAMGVRGKGEG